MRIFVTGATGFVGSAVVRDLLAAGHRVLALARSETAAAALAAIGADVHRGTLEDPASLAAGAAAADGVIHTAFIHDFSKFAENCEIDRRALAAFGDALAGSDRPLIVTSGTGLVETTRSATEADRVDRGAHAVPRVATEEAVDELVARGVHASVVRLPQVHGDGDHGFVPMLIAIARERGVAAHVDDGTNRWSAVHVGDAAPLYRLALEADVVGARWHAVADEGVPLRAIAEVIGRRLGLPVVSVPREEAAAHFGWFAGFAGRDMAATAEETRRRLNWVPTGPGLLEDLDRPAYFEVAPPRS